jgi:hypothetical protein
MASSTDDNEHVPFANVIDIIDLNSSGGFGPEIDALKNLRPRELNTMTNDELMQTIHRIRAVNDNAEPYDLFLSHLQCFCQVIYQERRIMALASSSSSI